MTRYLVCVAILDLSIQIKRCNMNFFIEYLKNPTKIGAILPSSGWLANKMVKGIYFVMCILQPICLPVPETATIIFGCLSLGAFKSFYIGIIGVLAGISIMYWLVKHFLHYFINRKGIQKKLELFRRCTKNYQVLIIGILFIVPVLPDEIVCLGAAVIGIDYLALLLIALPAKIISIGMIAYANEIGNALFINGYVVILIEIVILLLVSILIRHWNKGEI